MELTDEIECLWAGAGTTSTAWTNLRRVGLAVGDLDGTATPSSPTRRHYNRRGPGCANSHRGHRLLRVRPIRHYGGCARCHDNRAATTPELDITDPAFARPVQGLFVQ